MHYIKGCPCLFKVAWIADHALKNIYVIQKCASCGYTKEQCDYVFEELKSMKIVDTKPESAYISDLYQTYGELPFHCEEVDTNFHFERKSFAIVSLTRNCRCCVICFIIRLFQ